MLRLINLDHDKARILDWIDEIYKMGSTTESPDMIIAKFFAGQYKGLIGYDEVNDRIEEGFCLWYRVNDVIWVVSIFGRNLSAKWGPELIAFFKREGAKRVRFNSKLPQQFWNRLIGETTQLYAVYEKEI